MTSTPLPAGSYGGLAPAIRKTLTDGDATFVLGLPTTGAIAGAERVRLTQIRDSAQGVDAPALRDGRRPARAGLRPGEDEPGSGHRTPARSHEIISREGLGRSCPSCPHVNSRRDRGSATAAPRRPYLLLQPHRWPPPLPSHQCR